MNKLVVMGAGFGGIAAALRAKALGFDVTVIDKLPQPGGRAQRFMKSGYKHDAGPTVITAPFLFDELFALFNKRREDYVTFKALDTWYQFIYDDGERFNYGGSAEQIDAAIAAFSQDDSDSYHQLLADSKAIYQLGFEQLAHQPFHRFISMIKILPALLRLRSYLSVSQWVKRYISSEKLQQALSVSPLLVGGNPFDTTSIYALIHYLERKHGVHFAMGGTQALVDALHQLMLEQGIEVRLSQQVTGLQLTDKHITAVEINHSETLACDVCVSNIDPLYLYRHLLNDSASYLAKLRCRFAKPSMGLFVLFFGSTRQYAEVEHHSIIFGKAFKPLLDNIFHHQCLSDDVAIYLHRPTATDHSFAPEGHDSFYALVPVPNLTADIDWSVATAQMQQVILQRLHQTVLPDIELHAEHIFAMTPEDFQADYLSEHGAGFSIAPLFYQSAWFRFHNQAEGIENLFLTGAGAHPGAGLPGVLSSAKVVEQLMKQWLQRHDAHDYAVAQ